MVDQWLRILILSVHVLAASIWVGGLITVAAIVIPLSRRLPEKERVEYVRVAAARFAKLGWGAVIVLVITGIGNIWARGYDLGALAGPLWSTQWGGVLAVKLVMVTLMVVLAYVHERYLGPRALELGLKVSPGKRRVLMIAARLTVVLAVAVMVLGVLLANS